MSSGDLDTRLRSAGASLRRAVEPLDPGAAPSGATGPDRRRLFGLGAASPDDIGSDRRRLLGLLAAPSDDIGSARRVLLAAAAIVVMVLALAAVAVALRADDDSDVSTDLNGVPRLVLDEAIVGMPATGAVDLPLELAVRDASVEVALYEAAAPRRPGDTVEVAALTFRSLGDPNAIELDDGEPVTIRGTSGRIADDPAFGLSIAWKPEPSLLFMLATRDTGAREELLAMAEAATVSSGDLVPGPAGDTADPPRLRASVDDVDLWSGVFVPNSTVGHTVGYQSDDDSMRLVQLTTFAGSDAEAEVVRWMTAAQDPVEVRGHDGWTGAQVFTSGSSGSGSSDGTTEEETSTSTTRTLVWEEEPGVYVVMRGTGDGDGIGADELRQWAESLRPASPAEWAALGDRASSAAPPEAPASIEGDYDAGTWAVYFDEDGSVCAGIATESSSSSSCGSSPGGAEVLTDDAGRPLVVYGALPPGAVDVQVPGGTPWPSTAGTEDGRIIYAIALDDGPPPTEVVFFDADGREVARIDVGRAPATPAFTPSTIPGTVP